MLAPRGALDLAVAYHRQGDAKMRAAYQGSSTDSLKIREKITLAVRLRLEAIADKEAVRRATSLFALPQHAGEGAKLIWGTADDIWDVLQDSSRDVNWYSKRATLSAVYGATVLFWLGDESPGHAATWAFLDRRIENVMQIELAKAKIRDNKPLSAALAGPIWLLGKIKAPQMRDDLPGRASKF
jgi:ubiquinone biosynthesis protein COQ9